MKQINPDTEDELRRPPHDPERLKQAILGRRDESRALNEEWEYADREVWDQE
ncbi:MAG TPA: hypothetical protein VML55_26070 [Planctomycetaceae bacterium]|nr:hypothetical protein [Planctomycetaceae bacterium]